MTDKGPRNRTPRGDLQTSASSMTGAFSNLQRLAQMFGSDPQLLQPRQIVEHAPLLGNAAIGDPEDRNLLYLDAPPRWLDAPERALVRAGGNIAACDPVARAENIHHLLMPVGERGSDPPDPETNAFDAASLGDFRTCRPVRQEIMGVDTVDQREVAGVPDVVERFDKIDSVHSRTIPMAVAVDDMIKSIRRFGMSACSRLDGIDDEDERTTTDTQSAAHVEWRKE